MIFVALILSIAGMAGIAFWAYRNVAPGADRLPMQWSPNGTVNWRAPRLVAIALTPLLMLALIALSGWMTTWDIFTRAKWLEEVHETLANGMLLLVGVHLAGVLVGGFAIFHGHAHGTELPEAAHPLVYSLGFVIATGLLHLAGIAIGETMRWRPEVYSSCG